MSSWLILLYGFLCLNLQTCTLSCMNQKEEFYCENTLLSSIQRSERNSNVLTSSMIVMPERHTAQASQENQVNTTASLARVPSLLANFIFITVLRKKPTSK